MQRTSILLPPVLQRQASEAARRRGISLGELIRRSIAREAATAYGTETDAFWSVGQVFRSGSRDLAARHDDELYGPIRRHR